MGQLSGSPRTMATATLCGFAHKGDYNVWRMHGMAIVKENGGERMNWRARGGERRAATVCVAAEPDVVGPRWMRSIEFFSAI